MLIERAFPVVLGGLLGSLALVLARENTSASEYSASQPRTIENTILKTTSSRYPNSRISVALHELSGGDRLVVTTVSYLNDRGVIDLEQITGMASTLTSVIPVKLGQWSGEISGEWSSVREADEIKITMDW